MRYHILTAGIAVSALSLMAAGTLTRSPQGATRVATDKGIVEVLPVAGDAVRVTVLPPDTTLTPYFPSQSAILAPVASSMVTAAGPDTVFLAGPAFDVAIDRASGNVAFFDKQGNLLIEEAGGVDNAGDVKRVRLSAKNTGHIFGAGERGYHLALNGDSLHNYNRANYGYGEGDPRLAQMNITMPWIVSDKGFGILFDDYNRSDLLLGTDTISYISQTPRPLSYYFTRSAGSSMADAGSAGGSEADSGSLRSNESSLAGVMEAYTHLTGRQPLPPLWSLGYITSKYGYGNQDETLGVVDTLKNNGYPVDGLVLDLYWYGVETDMGRLDWDKNKWPDHRKMLADLKDNGVNVVAITQPYINKKGAIDNYNILADKGLLTKDKDGNIKDVHTWVGDAGMFDVSNPDTREWYWNRYRDLTADGMAGWWGDLGEPEAHPEEIVHANGQKASEYHNVYGNEWSRLVYEGMRRDFPDMRPLLLMRGGTAGLHRYGVFPWTGDVARSWEGMQPQVKLTLNSGLSGLAYMSSDIGGFAVDKEHPTDPELYVRWLQLGTFSPMLRTHAQLKPEPYHYPAQENILKKYINMRYEWLPYNYTLAFENASKGWPLARPLNFHGDNPDDKYAQIADEFLWGDEVLVAPVMKKGVVSRKVIFPAGKWINWWNPAQSYAGGSTASVAAPLDRLPLFVKAGSFIPQYTRKVENTGDYNPAFLTVKYFPTDAKTSYTLFEDDRKSPESIEQKEYALIHFEGEKKGSETNITVTTEGGYKGMPETKMLDLQIIGTSAPKNVTWNGTELAKGISRKAIRQYGWLYDAKTRTVTVIFPYDNGKAEISLR